MNRHKASISAIFFLFFLSGSFAQQDLLGKYTGAYITPSSRKDVSNGVLVQIASIEGGKVTGSFKLYGGSCVGDYALRGRFSGDQFTLRVEAGERQGCGTVRLLLTAKSGKLVGTYGKYDIELFKE